MIRSPTRSRICGYMLIDLTVALFIATALLIALAASIGNLHRAQRVMAEERAAARRLEDALLALQTSPPSPNADPDIQVQRLPSPANATAAQGIPAGHVWVRLSLPAPGPGKKAPSLVGLIPDRPAIGGTP